MNIEELLAYAAGELDAERARAVEGRLAADPEARATVARYRAVLEAARTDDSVAPTARAVEMARALFESHRASRAVQPASGRMRWLDRLDAVMADLLFDSRLQPLAVRRSQRSDVVQLAYRAAGLEIELRASWREREVVGRQVAESERGTWRIMGQISGDTEDLRASIALARSGEDVSIDEAACDETGIFALHAPPGTYDLCVQVPEGAIERPIVLAGIELP